MSAVELSVLFQFGAPRRYISGLEGVREGSEGVKVVLVDELLVWHDADEEIDRVEAEEDRSGISACS